MVDAPRNTTLTDAGSQVLDRINGGKTTIPYIAAKSRAYFDEKPHEAKTDGEVTYVMYKLLLKRWKAEPRWTTYALMRKAQRNIRLMPEVVDLCKGLAANNVEIPTMSTAYECAVDEIKRRFVDDYENSKVKEHGDIE